MIKQLPLLLIAALLLPQAVSYTVKIKCLIDLGDTQWLMTGSKFAPGKNIQHCNL